MARLPTLLVPGSLAAEGADPRLPPLDQITDWLRRRMPEFGGRGGALADRILVVRAKTGSGKSTVLPVGVFRILRARATPAAVRYRGPSVLCTQPRVLTAMSLAADVSSERRIGGARVRLNPDMVLGETVGFQTGPVSNRPPAGLVFATIGVLAVQLQQMEDAELMARYRFILVDEAHERSLAGDVALMLLRNFYLRNAGNPRLPFLLLTSATFDVARYADYFGVGPANVFDVEGRAYQITPHWPAEGANSYTAAAAEAVLRIHDEHPDDPPEKADVLVFMPGAKESAEVAAALLRALRDRAAAAEAAGAPPPPGFLVLTINREVVISRAGDFPLVFERPDRLPRVGGRPPARRVVVSTVVAETGLTIDTLRYVVDCGWSRAVEAYLPEGAAGLVTRPAPQSRIHQRMGRAGRLFDGDFYPLYTRRVFDALEPQQLPDIITAGPGEAFLAIVREQQRQKLRTGAVPEFRAEDMSLLDPPAPEAFLAVAGAAAALGLFAPRAPLPDRWPPSQSGSEGGGDGGAPLARRRGWGLTPLGFRASEFGRTPMEGARVLLAGPAEGAAASDLATAVALFGSSPGSLLANRGRPGKGRADGPPGAAALLAALPPYFAGATAGLGLELAFLRARLFLADDFAEGALLFDAFAARLAGAGGDLAAVEAWCEGLGLDFAALADLARRREEVLEEMAGAGVDPFRADARRLSLLGEAEFAAGLRAFKRCLYAGLRARLLVLEPEAHAYRNAQGLRVRAPPLCSPAQGEALAAALAARPGPAPPGPLLPDRARWLVTDGVRLAPVPKRPEEAAPPLLYRAEAGLVSALDGFVDPDPELGGARFFPPPG